MENSIKAVASLLRKCLSSYKYTYNSILGFYGCQVKHLRFRRTSELDKYLTDKPLLFCPYSNSSCLKSHYVSFFKNVINKLHRALNFTCHGVGTGGIVSVLVTPHCSTPRVPRG